MATVLNRFGLDGRVAVVTRAAAGLGGQELCLAIGSPGTPRP
jgi:hypothetical protein